MYPLAATLAAEDLTAGDEITQADDETVSDKAE
jgi:hypothetical protein